MKIRISDSNKKRYTHKYNPTIRTTMDMSFVQPLFSKFCMPKSKVKVNINSFLRLSPLTYPVFGKMSVVTKAFFVPIDFLYPNFASLMSQKPVVNVSGTSYQPKNLPRISNRSLALHLYTAHQWQSTTYLTLPSQGVEDMEDHLSVNLKECVGKFTYNDFVAAASDCVGDDNKITASLMIDNHPDVPFVSRWIDWYNEDNGGTTSANGTDRSNDTITEDDVWNAYYSADYVIAGNSQTRFVTLNNVGRCVYKILVALGYNVSMDDENLVSILPLLAYYKAYFDNCYPKRYIDWQQTAAYNLIKLFENQVEVDVVPEPITNTSSLSSYQRLIQVAFNTFMGDLGQTYSVHDVDWYSMHTASINNIDARIGVDNPNGVLTSVKTGSVNSIDSTNNVLSAGQNNPSAAPYSYIDSSSNITTWSLALLKRMQSYINKDSIIGNRVELWMRSHLDSDVYNEIYHTSDTLATSMFDVKVGDIDSTADTTDGNKGATLAQVSGKGLGGGSLAFTCRPNTYGYIIVFAYVLPREDYYQGTDNSLFLSDRYSLPTSEFDALGYEVTPASTVFDDNGISVYDVYKDVTQLKSKYICDGTQGFGFVPRMSQFKRMRSIVNGDFRRKSMSSSLQGFYLNPTMITRTLDALPEDLTSGILTFNKTQCPVASTNWQYIERYPWMSNYNRIFNNSYYVGAKTSGSIGEYYTDLADNFMLNCDVQILETNSLKPLAISYDTDVDNGSDTSVHPA